MYEELAYGLIVLAVVLSSLIVIYTMRKRGGRKEEQPEPKETAWRPQRSPFKIEKSVTRDSASRARDQLRILDLEREILSDAIRRLYEAHAEGKITEEEREKIAQSYKSRMRSIREAISKDESVVALHELETMQEDLISLFTERFDELNTKIDELRSAAGAETIKEVKIPIPAETKGSPNEKASRKERRPTKKKAEPKTSPRSEAEKRIEKIRAEVEKVLDKLGQMEIEG